MLTGVQPQYHPVCLTEAVDGPNQCKINCRQIKSVPKNVLQPCISDLPWSQAVVSAQACVRAGACAVAREGEINSGAKRVAGSPQKKVFQAVPHRAAAGHLPHSHTH